MKMVSRLCVLCIMVVLGLAGSSYGALDDGLVGFWSFDACDVGGVINDESGSGNNAFIISLNTNISPVCIPSLKGNAYRLWGGSACTFFGCGWGYINVPNSPSLSFLDNFSISLWFNIQDHLSMSGFGFFSDTQGMHSLMAKAGDRNGLIMRTLRWDDGLLRVLVHNGRFPFPDSFGDVTATPFDLDEWHLLTFTSGPLADGNVNVYFDGTLQFTWPALQFKVNDTMQFMPLQLGIDQDAMWYPLNGMLDEVRVYNRELAAAEVEQLFECTVDNQPPVIDAVVATPDLLWPPDHRLVPVTVSVTATDNCDPAPVCRIASVASNEPVNGLDDGDTAPDWVITGDLTLDLRAERAGSGVGRIYTITISCADASGNASEAAALVTVPLSQRR